jgi:hypothetical protein
LAEQSAELSGTAQSGATTAGTRRHVRWAAYAWAGIALISVIVAAPLALVSIVHQLLIPPDTQIYTLAGAPGTSAAPSSNTMRVTVTSIDEAKKTLSMRISAYRTCVPSCPALTIRFFALDGFVSDRSGPPSATVHVEENARVIMESVELPIRGLPSLYPFDQYHIIAGTSLAVGDGSGPMPAAAEAMLRSIPLTVESEVARFIMREPVLGGPETLPANEFHPAFQRVVELRFSRPVHLLVLTCLLVALTAAAAIVSVSTEPLRRLVVGVGSVILGVWGVRSILNSDAPNVVTAVDLLLSGVILILLYGIVIRLLLVWRREGWEGLQRTIQTG